MADAIDLYLDVSTPEGALVVGLNDKTTKALGAFYQGARPTFHIYPVVSTGTTTKPFFTVLSLTNLDLWMVVGPAAGSEAIKAAQYTWSKQTTPDADGASGYFYATLDLNTSDLNTAIGTASSYSTQVEFLLNRNSEGWAAVHQANITVKARVKDGSGSITLPTPAVNYMTRDECLAMFVAWRNDLIAANAGRNVVFSSPDTTKTRELGVGNDGAGIDNLG